MKLGHGDIDKLCSSSQWLVDQVVSSVQLKVSEELQSHGLSNDIRKSIVDSCASVSGNIFEGLHSRYLREKFYKEEFNYVKPDQVVLGDEWEWGSPNGARRVINGQSYGYSVSLLSSLKVLLKN
jgi:hypothetical protein